MKKTFVMIIVLSALSGYLKAQDQKIKFSIGPEISVPTFAGISSYGAGGGISIGYSFSKRIEGDFEISYNYFKANVYDFYKRDTIRGFSVMPVLPRFKYYFTRMFYFSGAAGLLIGVHNTANHFALSPGAGLLIPVKGRSKMDLGIKLTGVPTGYSFSENNFLNKGGYSFLTLRLAWVF